jgi:hypothetical protein
MKRYIVTILLFLGVFHGFGQVRSAQIATYPPQIHQQICRESTFTRYLDVFNTGDETLIFTAAFSTDTSNWATASPLSGEIQPGDTAQIEFNFNSAGLPIDNYYIDFIISSNDPDDPEHPVLCMLHVQDLHIILEAAEDTVCSGCSTTLNAIVFGCSEAYSFSWASIPPGFTSTLKSPVVSPLFTTTYIVTVTDGGYSKNDSIQVVVPGTTGIDDLPMHSDLKVYPNPVADAVKISINVAFSGRRIIRVMDLSGSILHSEELWLEEGTNELTLQTGAISRGTYLLSVQAENADGKASLGVSKIVVY